MLRSNVIVIRVKLNTGATVKSVMAKPQTVIQHKYTYISFNSSTRDPQTEKLVLEVSTLMKIRRACFNSNL